MMMNFRNMATMVNQFPVTFDFHDAFSIGKMEINCERKNKLAISNLKMVRNLKVIIKEEFITRLGHFRTITSNIM
jgi:hypothetical protein